MKPEEISVFSVKRSWSFMRFLKWTRSTVNKFVDWLSKPKEDYGSDESGMLMQRFMARQSWFDKISYSWSERSFFTQTSIIFAAVLLSGLIGLLMNASLLLMLSVGFIALVTHRLLASHERNRREAGFIIISESKPLIENLTHSKSLFVDMTHKVTAVIDDVQRPVAEMKGQVAVFNSECEILHQKQEVLIALVDKVNTTSVGRLQQDEAVNNSYKDIAEGLKQQKQVILQTTVKVEAVSNAASQFVESVADFQQSKANFLQVANHFSLLIQKPVASVNLVSKSSDFIQRTLAELDENDKLIQAWELQNQHRFVH